ncbi:aminopeptidase [Bergeyella sp. RCAD1439]|uniref:aminopeptidase n=1 Tax=Bergeyella anatis TaxID=3113737 RepID=UPI002E178BE0|nr:aminopeptidase [Bergeyella sp. RCAD1439]
MGKLWFWVLFWFCGVLFRAQGDSIEVRAILSQDLRTLDVHQTIRYKNKTATVQKEVVLLNWISAYRSRGTALAVRKLEDRKKDLYFASEDKLGELAQLTVNGNAVATGLDREQVSVALEKPLQSGETCELVLDYRLRLPDSRFTGYGVSEDGVSLKYFFLVPPTFSEGEDRVVQYYDIEETQSGGNHWGIKLDVPEGWFTESNLEKRDGFFSGVLATDPELWVTRKAPFRLKVEKDGRSTELVLMHEVDWAERPNLEFYLPLHLSFIREKTGLMPSKLLISEKILAKDKFFGIQDFKFWKFRFQLFSDVQKTDLNYFGVLAKSVLAQGGILNKNKDHWFLNGMKTYLEICYLNRFYPEAKLLGRLPEELSVLGVRPLNYFTIARMPLTERYGLAYQYIMTQNLDQRIGKPFVELSNFNDMAISKFETGSLFHFIADKMGQKAFEQVLRSYLEEGQGKPLEARDFLRRLSLASSGASAFLEPYFDRSVRLNLKLKKVEKIPEGYLVRIAQNEGFSLPIKITTEEDGGRKTSFWETTEAAKKEKDFLIPSDAVRKIQLNDGYVFPESNYRDNYLYTKGVFANAKKIRFKFFKDIPDPEYNEIYLNPRASFNAYDGVLLGMNIQNRALLDRPFSYSFTPYYSTGIRKVTGSGAVAYTLRPVDSFFRSFQAGISGAYFHYDYGLAYRRATVFSSLSLLKRMRSDVNEAFRFSYNFYEKDLTAEMRAANEYGRYGLWNLGYGYADNRLIHEQYYGGNFQFMKDFQKLSGEAFYRWEYAENKKMAFRVFAGWFLDNRTRNRWFDFGLSRVSNYAFAYNLLGQSATSGVLSQQFVLAEGGFKSDFRDTVNHWLVSTNADVHVWKMFNFYADAGVYRNKGENPRFLWDSGIKVKVIPDFLEVFLPLQSSLGFEPGFSDYAGRIRYTLVFNFGALTNYFRRGWF